MNVYYRLYDKQTGGYLSTGYNSTSLNELIEDYLEYISNGLEDEDIDKINNMRKKDKLSFIESNDFIIEKNNIKFNEID
jgi:hypothetical protein